MEQRELKFRAFDDGKMLTMPLDTNFGISRFFGILRDDAIVMQFTGIQDKNGKDVYEGDVIRDCITNAFLNVKFGHNKNNAYQGWYCKYIGIDVRDTSLNGDYDSNQNDNIEIIGNIYENPELISEL